MFFCDPYGKHRKISRLFSRFKDGIYIPKKEGSVWKIFRIFGITR